VHWFDFETPRELPADQVIAVKEGIMSGLAGLSRAAVDVRGGERLRADALAHLTTAARALDGKALPPGPCGYYDPERGVTIVADIPWLRSADESIAEGIATLQRSFGDPRSADKLVELAMADFDAALAQLSEKPAARR